LLSLPDAQIDTVLIIHVFLKHIKDDGDNIANPVDIE